MGLPTYGYTYSPDRITVGNHRLVYVTGTSRLHCATLVAPPSYDIIDVYRRLVRTIPETHSYVVPIYQPSRHRRAWASLGIRGKVKRGEDHQAAIVREGFEEFGIVPVEFEQVTTQTEPRKTTYLYQSSVDQVALPIVDSDDLFNHGPDDYSRRVIWLIHGPPEQLHTLAGRARLFPVHDSLEPIIGYGVVSKRRFLQLLDQFEAMHKRRDVRLIPL